MSSIFKGRFMTSKHNKKIFTAKKSNGLGSLGECHNTEVTTHHNKLRVPLTDWPGLAGRRILGFTACRHPYANARAGLH